MKSLFVETQRLLKQIECGDAQAIGSLLDLYRPRLKRMVSFRFDQRMAARFDPSDVVQDSLVTAHQRFGDFFQQTEIPFYVWLRGIAWNRMTDLHRQHIKAQCRAVGREIKLNWSLADDSLQQLADRIPTQSASPSRKLAQKELKRRVHDAIDRLPQIDREIVLLRHLEELSVNYVANILGMSESAVKSRHFRAIEKLRVFIDES